MSDSPERDPHTAPIDYTLIDYIEEARAMAHAEKPLHDELLANPETISSQTAFRLGMKAAEAALEAQYHYQVDAPMERGEDLPHVLATQADIEDFARRHGYTYVGMRRAWTGLVSGWIWNRRAPSAVVEDLMERLGQTAREGPGGWLDVTVARELIAYVVGQGGNRYDAENINPTIPSYGVRSLSLMAHFINETLGLEGDERIPLRTEGKHGRRT